jgi:hypothetical protein
MTPKDWENVALCASERGELAWHDRDDRRADREYITAAILFHGKYLAKPMVRN